MCTYLHKAPNGVYYFRLSIPVELRPRFDGRREIKHTLRTKDRDTAKKLIPDHTKAAMALLDDARALTAPAPLPKSQAQTDLERARWDWEREQEALIAADADDASNELDELGPVMDALAAGALPFARPAQVARAAQLAISHEKQMAVIQLEQQAYKQIARYAPGLTTAGNEPLLGADPTDLLTPGIFDLWRAEGDKRPKTIDMVGKTADWFQDRMGRLSVTAITKRHVLDFKNKLIAEGQSVANINVRLSHISLLLGWAARNDMVPANVAIATAIPNPQAKKSRRKPFDLLSLKAIFDGPVHAAGKRPAGGKREAAYWLPVLALFTGARIRELAQLRHSDVREVEYPDANGEMRKGWFLNITEDTDDEGLTNAIKNDASERLVPLAPKLIDLGFIRYVQGLADQKARIFPALPEDVYGNPAAKWGEWFSGYLRKVCLVTDKRMTFHSFRHTFKDYARDALIPEGIQRQFMGHEGGDVADTYGDGYSLHRLVSAMGTYTVPGLHIPPPVAQPVQ
jgi:integrase